MSEEIEIDYRDGDKYLKSNCPLTPEIVKIWAYDEDLWLLEQDEDLLLYNFEFIPVLLKLVLDDNYPKGDYAFCILCQFCREQVARGGSQGANALEKVVEDLPVQSVGNAKQWYEYVNRLLSYFYNPKPLSKSEAHRVADELLIGIAGRIGVVSESQSLNTNWWRFTLKTSVVEHIDICQKTGVFKYVCIY